MGGFTDGGGVIGATTGVGVGAWTTIGSGTVGGVVTDTFGEIGIGTGGMNLKEMPRLSKIVVTFSTNAI
jgi:hypothetical protein